MIKFVDGDILDCTEDILAHQVNCLGIMGGGLALQIRTKYPEVDVAYRDFVEHSEPNKLLGSVQIVKANDGKLIANIFSQYNVSSKKRQTDYEALKNGFEYLVRTCVSKKEETTIAIPYLIGCGLGGGNWDVVYPIIEEVFGEYGVTIYKFEPKF